MAQISDGEGSSVGIIAVRPLSCKEGFKKNKDGQVNKYKRNDKPISDMELSSQTEFDFKLCGTDRTMDQDNKSSRLRAGRSSPKHPYYSFFQYQNLATSAREHHKLSPFKDGSDSSSNVTLRVT